MIDDGGRRRLLYGCPRTDSRGQAVIHATREGYVATVKALLDDGYTMCVDLTAVDYLGIPGAHCPTGSTRSGSRSPSTSST